MKQKEIFFFLYKTMQDSTMFWLFVSVYAFLAWKALHWFRTGSDAFFFLGFILFVALAPVWGYTIGRRGQQIATDKQNLEKDLAMIESNQHTQNQKDFVGFRILDNPECDMIAIQKILQNTSQTSGLYDSALVKIKELKNKTIKKP